MEVQNPEGTVVVEVGHGRPLAMEIPNPEETVVVEVGHGGSNDIVGDMAHVVTMSLGSQTSSS